MVEEKKKEELQEKDFVEGGEIKRRRRSRKTIGEEGSRKQTAIGLLLTIGLGLFFYLPKEMKQWWQGLGGSEIITIEKPVGDEKDVSEIVGFKVEIEEKGDTEVVVKRMIENLAGRYGLWVEELEGKESLGINEEEVFGAASVIKLPILVVYYQMVDEGKIDEEEIYVLREEDRLEYGTGSMQNQPIGTEYSYKEIAELVANQSDNMATEVLMTKMGGYGVVQREVDKLGMEKTNLKENETTAKETGELLKLVYEGELISKESRERLFNSLTETVNEERITAGVPSGVRVVHKFGSEAGIVNDCGIVYTRKPYVICMLSTEVNDGEAQEVLPKISRVVWEWIGE